MIKLQVIGNLGRDALVKEVNGRSVISFTVAHSERYKDSQGVQKEKTTWVDCSYWTDKTAVAPYLTKGTTVYVEGTPEADAYMNKENQPTSVLRMRVQSIQLVGGKNTSDNQQQPAGGNAYQQQAPAYNAAPAYQAAPAYNAAPVSAPATSAPAADDLPF
jgi:single-strand DNA-binding protein